MAAMTNKPTNRPAAKRITINWRQFVAENITRTWWLALWILIITGITVRYAVIRLIAEPITTSIVLVIWLATVGLTVYNELRHQHSRQTLWLKNNMYSSITNIMISVLLVLFFISLLFGFYRYAVPTASFSNVPATDHRATFVAERERRTGLTEYCFNVGYIDPEASLTDFVESEERCYLNFSFDERLSRVDSLDDIAFGTEPAQFCFNEGDDPENGITCFETTPNDNAIFRITYRYSGANWGAVIANFWTLMVFRFDREEIWRVGLMVGLLIAMGSASVVVYRESNQNKRLRQLMTLLWLLSPIIFFIFLRGAPPPSESGGYSAVIPNILGVLVGAGVWYLNSWVNRHYPLEKGEPEWRRLARIVLSAGLAAGLIWALFGAVGLLFQGFGALSVGGEQVFPELDPDINWGGWLLTLIITIFAIVVSFPIGVAMALARRSEIRGVPWWITLPVVFAIMVWGLVTSTPQMLADARSGLETVVAYWPVALFALALAFQLVWKGNVLAAFSTLYIEFIRGIPLITVLFLAIILFPILLPENMEIRDIWRVMWGFTLFTAAYLAENVRGGLQAIPKGQYEAADSLGLSTFNKYRLIVLPQALRLVIPAITNQYIGLFKDTTLVAIVGLLDVLGVANAIAAQPQWLGVRREAYIFIGALYYVISAIIAGYSARLERRTGLGVR